MKWIIILFFVFSATAFSGTLFAECDKAYTTADMISCFGQAWKKADIELNRVYQLSFKGLDAKDATNLRKAQRTWVAYRDAQCNAEYGMWDGGSGAEPVRLQCLFAMTQLRTKELQENYIDREH
ncbi:MAG TPA: lysozyme inhibitor LprI family protein [Candidatus Angelobacter sp.]